MESIKRPQVTDESLDSVDRNIRVNTKLDSPYVVLFDNLLSAEECEEIIRLAEAKGLSTINSNVVDASTGKSVLHEARTSTGICFKKSEFPIIAKIEERLSKLTNWPITHGEGIQVLMYKEGQQYKPHFDFFNSSTEGGNVHMKRGGQRVGTTVMYLSCATKGGGTSFPKINAEFFPNPGGAIFFSDIDSNGEVDRKTLHAGMPVDDGVKIVATYWQREREFK